MNVAVSVTASTDDPISVFEEALNAPNPVLKILCDLFLESDTSDVFYTNDAKVLVDIIIRKLSSLSSGNQVKFLFLYSFSIPRIAHTHQLMYKCAL